MITLVRKPRRRRNRDNQLHRSTHNLHPTVDTHTIYHVPGPHKLPLQNGKSLLLLDLDRMARPTASEGLIRSRYTRRFPAPRQRVDSHQATTLSCCRRSLSILSTAIYVASNHYMAVLRSDQHRISEVP